MINKLQKIRDAYTIDCGDNSCLFCDKLTGMRTNGGCRCFNGRGNKPKPGECQAISVVWRSMPELLDTLNEVMKLLKDHESLKTVNECHMWNLRKDSLLKRLEDDN